MSKAFKESMANNRRTVTISEIDFNYLRDLEGVQRSFNYYQQRLITQYLKNISLKLGYDPEANLEFGLDLNTDTRELSIKQVVAPSDMPPEPLMHKAY